MLNPTSEAQINIVLHDGTSVSKEFYDRLREQVELAIPGLQPSVGYELKALCGLDFWEPLSRWQKLQAGKSMVHMVDRGVFPELTFFGSRHACRKRYCLK